MSIATMIDAIAALVGAVSDFQVGWDLYAAGGGDSDCRTPEQVRGWWMALQAEVDADMCSVLAADGLDGFEMDEVFDGLHSAYCN